MTVSDWVPISVAAYPSRTCSWTYSAGRVICPCPVLQRETELDIADRVMPGEQTLERFGGDGATEAEEVGLLAGPLPG